MTDTDNIKDLPTPRLRKLAKMVQKCHKGQFRADGKTPYFTHPLHVALTVKRWGGSELAIAAALSHDVLEDCNQKAKDDWELEVDILFSESEMQKIHCMTMALTVPPPASGWNRTKRYAVAAQQLVNCPWPEAVLVKCSDTCHNSLTLKEGKTRVFVLSFCNEVRELLKDLDPVVKANGWSKHANETQDNLRALELFANTEMPK